jgi:hypothetical protein
MVISHHISVNLVDLEIREISKKRKCLKRKKEIETFFL